MTHKLQGGATRNAIIHKWQGGATRNAIIHKWQCDATRSTMTHKWQCGATRSAIYHKFPVMLRRGQLEGLGAVKQADDAAEVLCEGGRREGDWQAGPGEERGIL